MIYAVLIMHVCLVAINYRISRSWLYPPVVFTLLWSIVLFCLILSGDFFYQISASTLLIFLLGSLAFSAGGTISIARKVRVSSIVISGSNWTSRVLDASLFLLIIMFPFYIKRLHDLSVMSGISDFWVGLRIQSASGFRENGFGIFSYVIMLGNLSSLGALVQLTKSTYSKNKTYLILAMAFSYGILSAGRLDSMMLLVSLSCIFALDNKLKIKHVLLIAIVFLSLFIVPAYFMGKGMNKKADFSQNAKSMKENIQVYFLGGPVAFDQGISTSDPGFSRDRSYLFFLRLYNALGLSESTTVPPITFEYSYTPRLTNVYTLYFTYFSDFGLAGVIAIMFMLGITLSFLYRFATLGDPVHVILYSLGFSGLMFSSANDMFLTTLSAWIQAVFFLFLLYKIPPLTFRRGASLPRLGLLFSRPSTPPRDSTS